MKKIVVALALSALAACAEVPTPEEISRADYGRATSQQECEAIARQNILSNLKDPASAQFTFSECKPTVMHSVPIAGLPIQAGYQIVASVNARNSFGGYTGAQPWVVLIKDGQAIRRTYYSDGMQLPY